MTTINPAPKPRKILKRHFTLWEDGYSLRSFTTKQEAHDFALSRNITEYEIRYKGHPIPPSLSLSEVMDTPALY